MANEPRVRRTAIVLAAFVLAGGPALPQQTPSFEASREVVRIDVVVVDDAGVPVRGLTAADFEIVEKGRKVPITSFEAVAPAPAAPATAVPAPAGAAAATAPRPAEPEHSRAFLILFDDVNLSEGPTERVRTALIKTLPTEVRDGDLVSLHTTSGLRFTARTADERLRMVQLARGLVGKRQTDVDLGKDGFATGVSDYEAMRISRGGGDLDPYASRHRDQLRATPTLAAIRYLQAKQRASAGLTALAHALVALEGFRGRKSLIVYSEGYVKDPDLPQYDQVIELARRMRVSVYFSDAFGLQTDGTRAEGRMPGQADSRHLMRLQEDAGGSAYVAVATGGRAVTAIDQSLLFREAATLSSAYYLLGFEPPEGKTGERRVEVKVRKGLKVIASDRYFVSAAAAAPDAAAELRAAMASMFESDDVPFTVATGWRDGVSSTTFVVSLARAAADPERRLDLRIEARPLGAGEPVRDAAELTIPRGATPARLTRDLSLRPGPWQARVAVRDRDTGRIGSVLHTFEVKDAAAGAPSGSPI
jgi:VWFA-related protein